MSGGRARSLILLLALGLCGSAIGADFGPYPAKVLRVIDGDTVLVELTLRTGFMPPGKFDVRVRLAGVDTPEPRGKSPCEREAARAATAFAKAWLARDGALEVLITGRDKYADRVDGRIRRGEEDLAQALLAAGHARVYDGGKRRAWC